MAALGIISNTDLECGEDKEGSVCFSDAVEGSCNSQFNDDCSFACGSEILEDGDLEYLDLESGEKAVQEVIERDCRICHLGLVSSSPSSGIAIQLGCSCKDDLAAAHKHCAETWFKIKGNKSVTLQFSIINIELWCVSV